MSKKIIIKIVTRKMYGNNLRSKKEKYRLRYFEKQKKLTVQKLNLIIHKNGNE